MGKRRKRRGHFCWVCSRMRPNEKFSGGGHAKHVCRDCGRLGAEELAYRQSVRDLERCLTWEGFVRRKQRASFERFLRHEDPRVREMAERVLSAESETRRLTREAEVDEAPAVDAELVHAPDDDACPF